MDKDKVVFLRIPAFLIDFAVIMLVIGTIDKTGRYLGLLSHSIPIELLMFVCIPLGFFLYWWVDINLGKRLFRLKMIDATTGSKPTALHYLKRCLLFSLVISLNVLFVIAPFVSRRGQALHDKLANTVVVRRS